MEPKVWMQNKRLVLKNKKLELLKEQAFHEEQTLLNEMSPEEQFDYMISKMNYCRRKHALSCLEFNVLIDVGDICYIDYGNSYINETGYLHFGLILALNHGKAFVVPITGSNNRLMEKDVEHVYKLGKVKGMKKICMCYLNDAKWINTSRIIDVKSHLPVLSKSFKEIKEKVIENMM